MRTRSEKSLEEKEILKYTLATYLDKDGWNYINGISRGCTTFVGQGDINEWKEINYLILQACVYYEKIDSEHWVSPLLKALRENSRIKLTTSDGTTYMEPTDPHMLDHYTAIDNMIDPGMTTRVDYMEAIWALTESSVTSTTGHTDMKATMEAIRGSVSTTKRSRL